MALDTPARRRSRLAVVEVAREASTEATGELVTRSRAWPGRLVTAGIARPWSSSRRCGSSAEYRG